jgi:hypothetical protein
MGLGFGIKLSWSHHPRRTARRQQYTVRGQDELDARYRETAPALVKNMAIANEVRFAATHPDIGQTTAYRAYYLAREQRHPVALCCCAAAIALGLVCLVLPSFEVFVLVVRRFFLGM